MRKLQAEIETWTRETFSRSIDWLNVAQRKLQHLPETNYDLGLKFARAGKLRDAQFRFNLALKIRPDWAECWHQLGLCQMRQNAKEDAVESFKQALRFDAGHADARYLLAVCDARALPEGKRPTTMPTSMIQGFFDSVANNYAAIEAANNYQASRVVVDVLRPHLPTLSGLHVLDAGCGIGHASLLWRKVAATLTGIDLTESMCAQARDAATPENVTLFDKVHHGDIRAASQYVRAHSQHVILCVNTLQFVGDLDGCFKELAACLSENGVIALTVEPYNASGYAVVPATARFGHSANYIASMAAKHGLMVKTQSSVQLYPKLSCLCAVLTHAPSGNAIPSESSAV